MDSACTRAARTFISYCKSSESVTQIKTQIHEHGQFLRSLREKRSHSAPTQLTPMRGGVANLFGDTCASAVVNCDTLTKSGGLFLAARPTAGQRRSVVPRPISSTVLSCALHIVRFHHSLLIGPLLHGFLLHELALLLQLLNSQGR